MGVFSNFLDPICVVLFLTVGTLINKNSSWRAHSLECGSGRSSRTSSPPRRPNFIPSPETGRFRHTLLSRLLEYFPFLLECLYWNLTYWPYQLSRALTTRVINSPPEKAHLVYETAEKNAIRILNIEKFFHIDFELGFQKFMMSLPSIVLEVLSNVYHSHILIGLAVVIYTYTVCPRPIFQRFRRTIFLDNWLAFLVLTFYRCSPPRLLPVEYGFIDVLHPDLQRGRENSNGTAPANATELPHALESRNVWTHNSFQLTIAAMPSLHFGTSLLIGYTLFTYAPHRFVRMIAPLWPTLMLTTIVATANHFILDACVGACIITLGWQLANTVLPVFTPLEQWLLWVLRADRPKSADVCKYDRTFGRETDWSDVDSEEDKSYTE